MFDAPPSDQLPIGPSHLDSHLPPKPDADVHQFNIRVTNGHAGRADASNSLEPVPVRDGDQRIQTGGASRRRVAHAHQHKSSLAIQRQRALEDSIEAAVLLLVAVALADHEVDPAVAVVIHGRGRVAAHIARTRDSAVERPEAAVAVVEH